MTGVDVSKLDYTSLTLVDTGLKVDEICYFGLLLSQ